MEIHTRGNPGLREEGSADMLIHSTFNGGGMDWFYITFREGVDATESQQKIKDVFVKFFTTSGTPENMGVFLRQDIMQQALTFYFTPTAASVAKVFGAFRCQQPEKLGITLFAGPDTCWSLFSESD